MSESIDSDLNLDLHFLPSWAKAPSNRNLYADFQGGGEERGDRRRDDRPGRRREGPQSRDRQGPRPEGGPRRPEFRRPDGPRGEGRPQGDRRPQGEGRFDRGSQGRPPQQEMLPEVNINFRPEEKGVDSLSRQIKVTGRTYPLFEVAQMVLAKPERHTVVFSVQKGPDGKPVQPLFVCALDDTLWLSEAEAVEYVLNKHFNTFYQAEKTEIEPPKGTYTFVAQCGMSGNILGPPNHHDYQNQLHKLHAERFSRMPFDVYKSRVRIVRDEAVIKKWLESQSFRTEYVCLNMPEAIRLGSRDEVVKHFRENHLPIIIKQVETHTMTGTASRNLRCQPLMRLVRAAWDEQRRFPMQISTVLSQQFASRGLQFFKFNKNITHVCIARPNFLEMEATPVSEGIRRIVEFINAHPKCTRRHLLEALAPAPTVVPVAHAPAAPAPVTETAAVPSPEGAEAPAQPAALPVLPTASPEATAIIGDLHWLVHQGHVIEFANGMLETAKKPVPKPPKPAAPSRVPAAPAAEVPAVEEAPSAVPDLSGEPVAPEPSAEEPAPVETPTVASPVAESAPTEPSAPVEEKPL